MARLNYLVKFYIDIILRFLNDEKVMRFQLSIDIKIALYFF